MAARVRVVSPDASYSPGLRSPYFGGADDEGVSLTVWIWGTGVGLTTDAQTTPGAGLQTIGFDAASQPHDYALVTDSLGASLLIDGVERIRLPYVNTHPSARNNILFGNDTRTSGATRTDWEYVRFATILHPADLRICPSGTATFFVDVGGPTGGPFSYLWRRNGAPIDTMTNPSAATSTLVLSSLSASSEASYDCVVTSGTCGTTTSRPATLTICADDFNCDGAVNPDDLGDFINCYFTIPVGVCTRADFNADGNIDPDDLGDFINAFFGPPC